MSKIKSIDEALDLIQDGAVVTTSGFVLWGMADWVFKAVEDRFLKTGHPNNLECVFTGSAGSEGSGFDRWAHDGLVSKIIAGHFGLNPNFCKYVSGNKCQAYNWPHGAILNSFRAAILGQKHFMSKIGLQTFVDPRLEGGKLNQVTTDDLIRVVEFEGEEWLYYPTPQFDIGIIRGTTADQNGNISIEDECGPMNMRDIAMAVKSCGGKVIVQVKNLSANKLTADRIEIPGAFVDAVVVCEEPEKYHRQTKDIYYSPRYAGHIDIPTDEVKALPLDPRKVIARRCAMELRPNSIVNLGIGVPELVANIAAEEGFADEVVMSVEAGMLGGVLGSGDTFGCAVNAIGLLSMAYNFDLYDGGNLGMAVLGLAECDAEGNINVSKFGPKLPGCGGFIDITQSTPLVIFASYFKASGAKVEKADGVLRILQEGKVKKFKNTVQQITFSGEYAASSGQKVLYVTERAVLELTKDGLMLTEIAPGVDLQRDVLDQMEFKPLIAEDLKIMDARIFTDCKMGFYPNHCGI